MDKKETLLFLTFSGEPVEVITTATQKVTVGSENHVAEEQTPLALHGILMDEDDDFLYLGDEQNGIGCAVRKNQIVAISLLEIKSVYDTMLEELQVPGKKEQQN